MRSPTIGKCTYRVRRIDSRNVRKMCVYRLPNGVRLKDCIVTKNENIDSSCVITLGSASMNIMESIVNNDNNHFVLNAHINHQNLYNAKADNKLYIMCDIENKKHLTSENKIVINEFVQAHKKVYLLTTLGTEMLRSGVLKELTKHLKLIGREVTVLAIKPFRFESALGRIEAIDKMLEQIANYVSKVIVFNNEDLINVSEISGFTIKECLNAMNHRIASVINDDYVCDNKECKDSKIIDISLCGIMNGRTS